MTYTLNYDSNLILFRQLGKIGIIYIGNVKAMILMKAKLLITCMGKNGNLFIFDIGSPNKTI